MGARASMTGNGPSSERGGAARGDPPALRVRGAWKTYAGAAQPAVQDLSFDLRDGEVLTLLGPSGCGKSTTLRLVAGLERLDRGTIFFEGELAASANRDFSLVPNKRPVGVVFQSYAIWPHMTVLQNVAFPLKAQKLCPRSEIRGRVKAALALVGMDAFIDRPAPRLSGGQQQRVAIARALITEPRVLLLDEPFSNLDAKLRVQMRLEVRQIQERLGIAVLFVTHDQIEALSLSNTIVVMNEGRVEQVGTPWQVYQHPDNEFVRDFVGSTVLLAGEVVSSSDASGVEVSITGPAQCVVSGLYMGSGMVEVGSPIRVAIRPEDMDLVAATSADRPENALHGRIDAALFIGDRIDYQVAVDDQDGVITVSADRHRPIEEGSSVWLLPRPAGHTVWEYHREAVSAAPGG